MTKSVVKELILTININLWMEMDTIRTSLILLAMQKNMKAKLFGQKMDQSKSIPTKVDLEEQPLKIVKLIMIQAHQIVLTSQTWTKNKSVKLPRNCKA
jgi:hypothetical protein